ncbi:FAD/NAD(P)-binding oxidoreductase [Saccharothrix sp. CB00851]|nr:FAD/NAD(P)-binding oxidoreductase [Saccharothrix sp. CB00851]
MAGARFAEQLRSRDPDGERVAVTAIGEEKHHPYNRVLLSTVVDGSLGRDGVALQAAGWAAEHGVDLRLGVGAAELDRVGRVITLSDGSTVDYDVAVLATGARPWLPPVEGLAGVGGEPAAGVVAFRTLDDCEQIQHTARTGAAVAVLGGGVLGLEAACALARRGVPVTVVHPVEHLMERQLDPGAAGVLARVLTGLGIEVRVGAEVRRWTPGYGLELADGRVVTADLVIVSAGMKPATDLARRAGLVVDRGVVVDDALRTSDFRVHAIGDCAQHPGTPSGLVQPAWEQAAVLADLVTGTDVSARYTGSPPVTRFKARDVDLMALGDSLVGLDAADSEVLCVTNAGRGRYAKLVVRDDKVAGAIVLGAPAAAAAITQFYDRDLPVPLDRLALVLGRTALVGGSEAPDPVDLPDTTVVCRCNAVTKSALVSAWHEGARGVAELVSRTRATTGCGGCAHAVGRLADWLSTTGNADALT